MRYAGLHVTRNQIKMIPAITIDLKDDPRRSDGAGEIDSRKWRKMPKERLGGDALQPCSKAHANEQQESD